ncbi:MAG TPA: hypothetical protein VF603_04285 [Allosphingosinicella sp.]|jgi:hypothetical protein
MSSKASPGAGDTASFVPDFDPVPVRPRHDGWTPARQVAFIRALAECGCVREACRRVGMSAESAYELARRPDAQSFRAAWEVALDNAVRRVGDNAFSRALNGVEIPHFYKGELIGTHRRYDERLTMFILRYRDPIRYGKHLDRMGVAGLREDRALDLADALAWVRSDAEREAAGLPRSVHTDLGAANDDEDRPPRSRQHIYDFAPTPADPHGDGEVDPLADEDEDEEELNEEEAAWATVRATALARAEQDGRTEAEIDDMIAFARRRSARGAPPGEAPSGPQDQSPHRRTPPDDALAEPPPPPDVARASSTSEPPDGRDDPPPMGGLWR